MSIAARANIANFIGFQLLWAAVVWGGAKGVWYLGWPFLALMLLLQWAAGRPDRQVLTRDLAMMLVGWLVCLMLEPMLLLSHVLDYRHWPHSAAAPGGIWALWAGFAVTLYYSLGWLRGKLWLAALVGGAGGAFSMMAGINIGAAQAPRGLSTLLIVYGIVWAALVPVMVVLSDRVLSAQAIRVRQQSKGGIHGR